MPIPRDRFTPNGYLDNPSHTRNLNPSGVIRSSPGIGIAWHFPALAGGYGAREIYRAALEIALVDRGGAAISRQQLGDLHADIHTCNRLRLRYEALGLLVTATFYRVGEHVLACRLKLRNPGSAARSVRVAALARHARHLGAAGVWGESGVVCREEGGAAVVQGFEDGAAFAMLADREANAIGAWAPHASVTSSGTAAAEAACSALPEASALMAPALANGDHALVTGHRGDTVTLTALAVYDLSLPAGGSMHLDVVLARHVRRDLAVARARQALTSRHEALSLARQADERFWREAPQLAGDWPAPWRRGFVTDLETLRMMVKPATGIYQHVWDAMQIHAPRAVLAETAIDSLLLSYADPDTAKALMLGVFADAPAANVPCSREDGSYNMLGANGSACGTAPAWGYPVEVIRHLYRIAPDRSWLAALYPLLGRFLDWWLSERSDHEGYLVYDNSWESGQDLSARFGPQPEGGGSTIRTLRPVDLQAAMAKACHAMAYFAVELGCSSEAQRWDLLAQDFRRRTKALWHDGAYRDRDAGVGFSDVWDVMQLAPVALGLAPGDHVESLRPTIAALADTPYLWPMFVWTAVDAALVAGEQSVATKVASTTIDRAWRTWDRFAVASGEPLPGVTCEYWGVDGHCGAEGYGWGAFGIHLLIHVVLGFRPQDDALELHPDLPAELRLPGKRYRVVNLPWRETRVDIELEVLDVDSQPVTAAAAAVTASGSRARRPGDYDLLVSVIDRRGGLWERVGVSARPSSSITVQLRRGASLRLRRRQAPTTGPSTPRGTDGS